MATEHAAAPGANSIPTAVFDELFERLKTWGRWGDDDELGALNHVGPADVVTAGRLVKLGRQVSLGRPLDTVASADNPRPALHHMTKLGYLTEEEPRSNRDFIGIDYHGKAASHLDALAHMTYRGRLYNGRRASSVVDLNGSQFAPVSVLANGIVTRGVLLDVARARGVDWVEPPDSLGPGDLADVAGRLGVEVRRGDAVLVRSGQVPRRRAMAVGGPDLSSVGLGLDGFAWLAGREIALLGGDDDSDARPSPVQGLASPIHALALVAVGMCLLDNLNLEALGAACAEAGTFEFLLVVAPLIVTGGTGSPVNPVALL